MILSGDLCLHEKTRQNTRLCFSTVACLHNWRYHLQLRSTYARSDVMELPCLFPCFSSDFLFNPAIHGVIQAAYRRFDASLHVCADQRCADLLRPVSHESQGDCGERLRTDKPRLRQSVFSAKENRGSSRRAAPRRLPPAPGLEITCRTACRGTGRRA